MASSYGYTDEIIGDLPLIRFRQMTAAIQLRMLTRRREEVSLASWQTRMITTYISGGYMIDKGKPNVAFDNAQTMGYDDIERVSLGGEEAGKPRENKVGSYERLVGWAQAGMTKRD